MMVYGDGKIVGHDLERTEEASPVLSFLIERYPVVIGKGFFFCVSIVRWILEGIDD